jgi:hypothetical protein
MTISIPGAGFIEVDSDYYWSLSDEELAKFEEKIKSGYYKMDDSDPLYSKRDINDDLDFSSEEE